MADDRQTYQRATTAALIALVVQLVLSIAMALIGLKSQLPALHAATFHLLGGLPIWVILWMLYNQHRLERIETLEAEQLARDDSQAAAIFSEHGDDLNLARRRLQNFYKWGLGAVSVFLAVYLLAMGGLWLYLGGQLLQIIKASTSDLGPLVLLGLSAAVAFVAFVMARYVAGMTQIAEWQLLRGGASYLMGNALVAVLIMVAAFLQWIQVPFVFAVLGAGIPLLLILIGIEIIVTFLLSAYRPRRPGEVPRPAFDSRVLGLLTSPVSIAQAINEAINYQFGFEISRSWFYQLLGRAITPLIALGMAVLILISCIVVVDPHEQALITRGGAIVRPPVPPGRHWKWFWPISRVEKYPVRRIHQVSVGSVKTTVDKSRAILWTTEHTTEGEDYLITGATPVMAKLGGPSTDNTIAVGQGVPGMALVAADVIVQFRIADLVKFVKNAASPKALIRALKQSQKWDDLAKKWHDGGMDGPDPLQGKIPIDACPLLTAISNRVVTAYFAQRDIDTLLARQRIVAGRELRQLIQTIADEQNLGLDIVFVGLAGIHPPQKGEVALAFHNQIGALQESQSAVEKARTEAIQTMASAAGSEERALLIYQQILKLEEIRNQDDPKPKRDEKIEDQEQVINQMLTESGGEAAQAIYDALAYRWTRAIDASSRAQQFVAQTEAYKQAPQYYMARLRHRALAESGARFVVVPQDTEIRMDAKETASQLGGILGEP